MASPMEAEEKTQPVSNIEEKAPEVKEDAGSSQSGHSEDGTNPQYPGSAMRPLQRRILMLSLCLALFLAALDMTIVATALPTIARTLGASAAEYAWVGSSYTLASCSSSPIWAKTSDIFGRKAMLMLSNGFFMAGSLVAAQANDPGVLIAGRVVQGVGGGGLLVLVTIIIADLFAMEVRAKYYGLTGMVFAVASSLGPVLGGVFTQAVGWRWCFYINLPFDGVSLVMLFFALKLEQPKTDLIAGLRSLDWIGSLTIVSGTLCFLFGLETGAGGVQPWSSAQVICLLVFGIVILGIFVFFEAKLAKDPMIPTRIFRSRTNAAAFATTCLHSFTFISLDYFLPLYYQAVLGHSPIISGVSMFAFVIPLSLVTAGTGFFVRRTGNYMWPMFFGGVMMTLGIGLFIDFGTRTQWFKIIIFPMIAGIGAGPMFQTPMLALQNHVEPKDVTAATSALSFIRTLFSSVSIVIGSVLLQHTLGGGSLSDASAKNSTANDDQSYVTALRNMWGFFTATSGLMLCCVFGIKGMKKKASGAKGGEDKSESSEKT